MQKNIPNFLDRFHDGLLAGLYAVMACAQVLGILKVYFRIPAILVTIALAVLVGWLIFKNPFQDKNEDAPDPKQHFDGLFVLLGLILFSAFVLTPLVRWPQSPINRELTWDAGEYHFPKAVELARTGSAWDFSISYGEYPFGYESVLAFMLQVTDNSLEPGVVHAVLAVFFILTMVLLMRRFTRLPAGLSFLLATLLLLSNIFPIESNIWAVLRPLVYTIGKNDVFAGTAILAVILYIPMHEKELNKAQLIRLALGTGMALAIKPTAVYIVLPAWAWVMFKMLKSKRAAGRVNRLRALVLPGLLVMPGCLWMARNLIQQGALFSEQVMQLQGLSIASHLTDPRFYQNIPASLVILLGVVVFNSVLIFVLRKPHRWFLVLVQLGLLVVFAVTPASAFASETQERAEVAWRFAIPVLWFAFVLLCAVFEGWISRMLEWFWQKPWARVLLITAAVGLSVYMGWENRWLLAYQGDGGRVMREPFAQAVGVDGYFSAFDYVQKNVRNAVVWVENGQSYYAYDPGFTNSVTRNRKAQYLVVFQTNWLGGEPAGYPALIAQADFASTWELIYEDSQGRVYKRK